METKLEARMKVDKFQDGCKSSTVKKPESSLQSWLPAMLDKMHMKQMSYRNRQTHFDQNYMQKLLYQQIYNTLK